MTICPCKSREAEDIADERAQPLGFPLCRICLGGSGRAHQAFGGRVPVRTRNVEHDNLLLSRHYYILSQGKNRKITNGHNKVVSGEADLNKDGKAGAPVIALQDGDVSAFLKPGTGHIKMEFPHLTAAHQEAETLSICTHTHTQRAPDISS